MSELTEHLIKQVLIDCQGELSKTGINLGRQLGCGDYGCAYAIGLDKVLKISTHKKEADAARWLLAQETYPANYPKIYDVWVWDCYGEKPIYVILREDIDDLKDINLEWFGHVIGDFEMILNDDAVNKRLTEDKIDNAILELYEEFSGLPEDENRFYDQLRDLFVWNAKKGLWLDDIIVSNWGQKKDGTIAIRDLGAIKLLS